MGGMEVRFLGSGDTFGSGGRLHTCIHVRSEETTFLIDCGASSLIAMKRFGVDPSAIDSVEVSVVPVLLGEGVPLLPPKPSSERFKLRLASSRTFKTGSVSLEYAVE